MAASSALWRMVHAFRLRRHHLDRPAARTQLVDVVRDTCGIQSQIPSAAELALRARVRGLRREDVTRALERDRTLVRAWTIRWALHLIPSEDFLLYTRALLPRIARATRWMNRAGLTSAAAEAIVDGIVEALADGPLTRRALADRVVSKLGERARRWVEHGWGGLVALACMKGSVCFGPKRGNEVMFVSRTEWLPDQRDYSTEEAGRILVLRYLRAFGPATRQDFQRWTEMPMPDVDAMWACAGAELTTVQVDGGPGSIAKADMRALRAPRSSGGIVRLLPSFDAYLLGHRDKAHLVDAAHYKRVYRKAGWLSPVVLVDGRVAGVWSMDRKGSRVRIGVEPFLRLSTAVREGIEAEVSDIGRFLDAAAEPDIGRRG